MTYLTMEAALGAHQRVADRFSGLLRTASDGTRKVPHLTWTVGETGAHVLCAHRLYPEMLAGVSGGWASLRGGEAENARQLAGIPERGPREIADALDSAAPKMREAFATYAEDYATWHAGARIPLAAMVGMLVGDMLVHGWDIATAIDGTWIIDRGDACLSFAATMPVIAHFVEEDAARGFSAIYGVQLRRGPTFTFISRGPSHGNRRSTVQWRLSDVGRSGRESFNRLWQSSCVASSDQRPVDRLWTTPLAWTEVAFASG